jgi:hypothetical protein
VFAYGRSLYIYLTEYRHRQDDPNTVNMPNRRSPEPSGLLNRQVLFVPAEALRSDQFAPSFSEDPANVLIIDYDLLAKLPPSSPLAPITSPPTEKIQIPPTVPQLQPTDTDLRAIREDLRKKDSEVEELRKELQEIKRQLSEQPTSPSRGTVTPPRPARPTDRTP